MNNTPEPLSSLFISSLGWILLVVAALVFFLFGQPYYFKKGYEQGATDRWQADMARVQQRFNIPSDTLLEAVSGRIVEIRGQVVVVETLEQPVNPLLDPYPTRREVSINEETVLKSRRIKTEAEIKQDPAGQTFAENTIAFSVFAVGDEVLATSLSENIAYSPKFIAKELFKNTTPAPVGPVVR